MSADRTWTVTLTPDQARALHAKIPEGAGELPPIVLTVEVDADEMGALYRSALTNKGGRAKSGPVSVRRGRS